MKNGLRKELHSLNFFMSCVWKASHSYVIAAFLQSFFEAALPFVAILLPKYMIDEMLGTKRISVLAEYVLIAAFSALILSLASNALRRYMRAVTKDIMVGFESEIGSHNMGVAYEKLEDTNYIEQKDKAMIPIRERMTHYVMVHYLPDMVRYFITAAGAVGILFSFDFISLIVILLPTLFIAWLNKWYQRKDMEVQKEMAALERFFMYYYRLIDDFSPGKDIRLFGIHELLMKRNNECDDNIFKFRRHSSMLRRNFEGTSKLLESFRSAFVYGYIGVKALVSGTGIGNFTMYTGAAATFSNAMAQLLNIIISLRQDCRYLEEFVKLQEIPVEEDSEGIKDIDSSRICLEFCNVSFRYPGTERNILKDVSFKLEKGQSLSIVGRNGAGKTTIIKLLSRFFKPTGGQILINGTDIYEMDTETYRQLLAVVFQDFKIFDFSIEDNISAGKELDYDRLESAMKSAGILEKVQSLAAGSSTYIGKQFDKEGTEFSGGELQKLAIARALYKNSPVIVLDEPTAALDPYAEEEVYERFHELTGGRTAVYISHRLSSCKFCQRIIFLDDGTITEDGSHDSLMRFNGKYAEMFRMQASQYVS